jgi:uncharacterized protein
VTTALILADTHVPSFRRELPPELQPELERCEVILHGGDVTDPAVLDQLAAFAPVHAVLGNMDGPDLAAWGAPQRLEIEVSGVAVAMVHDGGQAQGRPQRLRRWFPAAELVVYGHSHAPEIVRVDDLTIVNPGSPTWKRRQPYPTFAVADLEPGRVDVRLVEILSALNGE